jgi:hypothetical protein
MKKIFLLVLLGFSLVGCKKDIDELPEPTQTGANTFGAKVEGAFWVPQGFGIVPTSPLLEARYSGNNSIVINARNFASSPTETEFELYLQNVTGTGTVLLNQNTSNYPGQGASYGYYVKRRIRPLFEYITSAQNTGRVEITRFDKDANVISGTFEFRGADVTDPSQTVTVTEGRFDVKIQ